MRHRVRTPECDDCDEQGRHVRAVPHRAVRELTFTADDVLHRVDDHGDLLAELDATRVALPSR